MLDVIVVPAFYSNQTSQFPFQLTLANAFGLPIFGGLLVGYNLRKNQFALFVSGRQSLPVRWLFGR